ncbi:hypothetical protein [Rhizobium etli]|uniref:Uncharacterized protein n=1 Tax=Rhizobium etli TaxID=29449 RepID=A0A7W7EFS5_RHIET|nr:hypothetical protein [Rhizobium etli]MBB4481296.1 hypothetical protein [Rhizobium etli]MBB4537091.1 hypothetical protein [Rhizobium etli]
MLDRAGENETPPLGAAMVVLPEPEAPINIATDMVSSAWSRRNAFNE